MATDYDAPRKVSGDVALNSVAELRLALPVLAPPVGADIDEVDAVEGFELPGADLSGEELLIRVVPQQADEFTCSRCFLVQHHHRRASPPGAPPVCRDCAS